MSMKKFLSIIITVLLGHFSYGQVGFSINGTITDVKGLTLPGVTVFVSGTKIVTACDNGGNFHLNNVPPGSYIVIAKMIGFEPATVLVDVKDKPVSINIKLKESLSQLHTVVITADPNWENYFEKFKKWFLGTTSNAEKCNIINKEALHFHFDKVTKTLTATADELLIIENGELGYKISYLLESFQLNENTHVATYQGYPSFQDMKAKSQKQSLAWEKNRSVAYNGSINHFMKSLISDNLYKEGFVAFSIVNKPPIGTPYDPEKPITFDARPVLFDSLLTAKDKNLKSLSYKNCLFVVYTKEREPFGLKDSGYQLTRPKGEIPHGEYSMINLLSDSVDIDVNGNFDPPGALLFEGFMAWEQVADLTPLEYSTNQ